MIIQTKPTNKKYQINDKKFVIFFELQEEGKTLTITRLKPRLYLEQ